MFTAHNKLRLKRKRVTVLISDKTVLDLCLQCLHTQHYESQDSIVTSQALLPAFLHMLILCSDKRLLIKWSPMFLLETHWIPSLCLLWNQLYLMLIFLLPSLPPSPSACSSFDSVLLLSQGWSQTPRLPESAGITVMCHHARLVSASFSFLFFSPPTLLWQWSWNQGLTYAMQEHLLCFLSIVL